MRHSSALACAAVVFFSAAFLTGCGCDEGNGPARIKINNVTSAEGDAGMTEFVFTVTLTSDPGADVTVDYTTSDGTATTGDNDYVSTSGTITFTTGSGMMFVGGGAQAQTVTVRVYGDTAIEPDETFNVDLFNATNATIADSRGVGTIRNDESEITIGDATGLEGDSGTTDFVFTVALTSDLGVDVTVDYATSDGTATAGTDYAVASGTVTFVTGGPLTQQITVQVAGDTDMEPDETFNVGLFNPSNATIGDNLGIGTIRNDDGIRVDPTGNGTDGLTWATAFQTVQEGVDAAFATGGGEVWVAAAIYTNGGGTGPVVTMAADVHIYGGFEGYAGGSGAQETTCSERDWSANVTVLDGEDNAYHVVIGADSATLDGFTVTRGNANGADLDCHGGGMFNDRSSPIVTNCTFSGNSANERGGGMCNWFDCSPAVTDCAFTGNSAGDGGGMFNFIKATSVVMNCTFVGNSAGWRGGGMSNLWEPSPTVTNCTFAGNSCISGGGMYNDLSSPIVTNCTFSGNSANGDGGGMYNDRSSPIVTNCTFSGNSAAYGGGMYNWFNSSPEIMDCTFTGNSAASRGGGMVNHACSSLPVVTDCTFSGNSANGDGGGMYNDRSSPIVTNCTFTGNSADDGGGMYNYWDSSPAVTNCIMWGDTAGTAGPEINNDATSPVTARYSDIAGCGGSGAGWDATIGTDAGGNMDSDPLFVDADGADDIYGTADDDLHLTAGSPCIDSADGDAAAATDIEGNPRYDDPGSPNTGVGPPWADMGAYEYRP